MLFQTASLVLAQTTQTAASTLVLMVDPTQSSVQWTLDATLHAVHGTFAVKSGSINLDPGTGKAGGEIIVSATSGESGNSSRDARMHKEILETAKYPDIAFRPTQVQGTVSAYGVEDIKVKGVLSIHGADHDLTVDLHVEITGEHWKATGKFEAPYVQWGIKDPSNFFLKVKPVVNVEVLMSGVVKTIRRP